MSLRLASILATLGLTLGLGPLASAAKVLDFFDTALPAFESLPHHRALVEQVRSIREKLDGILGHDELGPINEPFYFLQVAKHAADHGLTYVADTMLVTDWVTAYPK